MYAALFSIVILCRNEERYVAKALESIWLQTIVDSDTSVIISDAGSHDRTLKAIEKHSEKMNIRVVSGGLPPKGRNNGARYCNTKYILFMDADVELGSHDVLERILEAAERKQLDLVLPQIKIDHADWRDKLFEYLYFLTAKTKLLGAFGSGTFIFMKTDTFMELGTFNENLPIGDDWELTAKVSPDRFTIVDTPVYISRRKFADPGYLTTFYIWASAALHKKARNKGRLEYFQNNYSG